MKFNPIALTAIGLALAMTACGGTPTVNGGTTPAKCQYDSSILATDPKCVAPTTPPVTPPVTSTFKVYGPAGYGTVYDLAKAGNVFTGLTAKDMTADQVKNWKGLGCFGSDKGCILQDTTQTDPTKTYYGTDYTTYGKIGK